MQVRFYIAVFIAFLLQIYDARGQEIASRHYSPENGLASSEVYDVHQDKRGYIWFATDRGLCRFDGYNFQTYTVKHGLGDNVIFSITEDEKGVLWLPTFSAGVYCYSADSGFFPAPFNKDILKIIKQHTWIDKLTLDNTGTTWMSVRSSPDKNTYYYFKDGKFGKLHFPDVAPRETAILPVGNEFIFKKDFIINSEPIAIRKGSHNSTILKLTTENIEDCIYLEDSSILCAYANKIVRYKDYKILDTLSFPNQLQCVHKDNHQNIWILSANGAYVFKGTDFRKPLGYYFKDKSITGLFHDAEGNYWFTTLNHGVYMVPSLQFVISAEIPERIMDLLVVNNKLYGTTFSKKTFTVSGTKAAYEFNKVSKSGHQTEELRNYPILGTEYLINKNGQVVAGAVTSKLKCHTAFTNNQVLGFTDGFEFIAANGNVFLSYEKNFRLRAISLANNNTDKVWIGTLFGLYSFNTTTYEITKIDLLTQRTNALVYNAVSNTLIAGTAGEGLYFLTGNSKKIITETDGLAGNYINTLLLQDTVLWVGTNKGLSRVILDPAGVPKSYESYTREDGLLSNEINIFALYNNLLWIGTNKGLTYVNPATLAPKKPVKIPVYLTNIVINDSLYQLGTKDLSLEYNQKNITINYSNVIFGNPSASAYYYKLEGLHTTWLKTTQKNVKFVNLPPGTYTFHVASAGLNNTIDFENTASVKIFIDRHFTQTWWFITICVITGITLIIYALYLYLQNHKKKLAIQRNIILSEQKALRAQMNPHFIFNALNSVQYYITENDKRSAGIFLAKFSGLIRSVLDNSSQSMITLEEELETITKYLELEQIRFGNRFRYEIGIDPHLSLSDIKVPSMLIQPFLENAIWHGLMPKKEPGNLNFTVRQENDNLVCIIEDNGIGREKAAQVKRNKPGHISSAIKNIEERINLIKLLLGIKIHLGIEDLFDKSGESSGTRVYLKIQMQK